MRSINTRQTRIALWTLAAILVFGLTATALASRVGPAEVRVVGGTVSQRATVTAEVGRYVSAGLELPGLEIHIYDNRDGCGGNDGVFVKAEEGWRINICDTREMVVRHEVGHAWAAHNLTAQETDAYTTHWGFGSWNARGTAWSDRGSEDAANVLAWGLDPQTISGALLPDGPLAKRAEAFQMLTGIETPRLNGN